MKIKKKNKKKIAGWGLGSRGGGPVGGGGGGGQGGWEQRSEACVKIPKKKNWWGGVGSGVRFFFFFFGGGGGQSGCEWRSKFCENSKKKIWGGGRVRGGVVGLGGGGVRVDGNGELKLL